MTKSAIRIIAVVLIIASIMAVPIPAGAADVLPNKLFISTSTSGICTLGASVMMLRATAYLNGKNWQSITESSVKPVAWTSSGLKHSWTYNIDSKNSISVNHCSLKGISISELKSLLNAHPEGVAMYFEKVPHAIFITDYVGDTFYCADPTYYYSGKRMKVADSWVGYKMGSQANALKNATCYWYVESTSFGGVTSIAPPTVTKPEPIICKCSTDYAGIYRCTVSSSLNIRSDHTTSSGTIGSIPANAYVNVSMAGTDGWAHVEYKGISGYASMSYLKKADINYIEGRPTGDINSDMKLSNADVVLLSRCIIEITETTDDIIYYGDFNNDGVISNADLIALSVLVI